MSAPEYLTRGQALDLIDGAEDCGIDSLQYLSHQWIGHPNADLNAEDLHTLLREYVEARCVDGDEIRARGPSYSDMTDLEDPT